MHPIAELCSLILAFQYLVVLSTAEYNPCPNIIERARWGARRWKSANYVVPPLLYVVVHHTSTPECNKFSSCADVVKSIQNYHMDDLKWHDIGHNFLVGSDGNVYEGTGWTMEGSHTPGYNKKAISIAFIGNYQQSYRNSTHEVSVLREVKESNLRLAHDLIQCGKTEGYLRQNVKVIGARQVTNTVSPGNLLFERIQRWPEWTVVPRN